MSEGATAERKGRKLRRVGYWGLIALAWGAIALFIAVFYFALTLPRTDNLWDVDYAPEVRFYSALDMPLAQRGRKGGQPVQYRDLPAHLVDAVVAIEDRRFFSHIGLDPRGLARAMLVNLRARRLQQGGSTLTQQLAKNVFLTPERTLKRKIQELLLAFWLEAQFSKQEILALYLNRVYFGNGAYGISTAAQSYFGRSVQNLTLDEAAILAGLLKAPSRYAPTRDPQAAIMRRQLVLQAMQEMNKITADEANWAATQPIKISRPVREIAPYAIDWVQDLLPDFVGRPRTDLDVITTLDPKLQAAAEFALKRIMDSHADLRNAQQAAMVVMTPDGAIRAIVGGRSYLKSQYNRAVLARRQPGSSFKPIVYLTALKAGFEADNIFVDEPIDINGWSPSNYDDSYRGQVSLREALALSINTVAAQLTEQTGRGAIIDMAHRLGIRSVLRPQPSLALGSFEVTLLDLTTVYAHFANGGRQIVPHVIQSVITANGTQLYNRRPSPPPQLVNPNYIHALNDMLVYALEKGTGRRAAISGLQLAGKTGTSQNWRDAWFVGYSGALVAGVWVGNDDGRPMRKVTGGGMPAQIWRHFMVSQKT
ncbi:MAG: transglycosylase domain-containing protein, partial [Parvibaculales bacterium]